MRHQEPKIRRRGITACSVIAVLFLAAQFFGLTHAAQYIDSSHHHDEAPCAIHFIVDTAKTFLAPSAPRDLALFLSIDVRPLGATRQVYLSRDISNRSIRGPPSFLL
jgi:hypothetical protein